MTLNINLEDVPDAILEAVKARIMASRRRLLDRQELLRQPPLQPKPQSRKFGADSKTWKRPEPAAVAVAILGEKWIADFKGNYQTLLFFRTNTSAPNEDLGAYFLSGFFKSTNGGMFTYLLSSNVRQGVPSRIATIVPNPEGAFLDTDPPEIDLAGGPLIQQQNGTSTPAPAAKITGYNEYSPDIQGTPGILFPGGFELPSLYATFVLHKTRSYDLTPWPNHSYGPNWPIIFGRSASPNPIYDGIPVGVSNFKQSVDFKGYVKAPSQVRPGPLSTPGQSLFRSIELFFYCGTTNPITNDPDPNTDYSRDFSISISIGDTTEGSELGWGTYLEIFCFGNLADSSADGLLAKPSFQQVLGPVDTWSQWQLKCNANGLMTYKIAGVEGSVNILQQNQRLPFSEVKQVLAVITFNHRESLYNENPLQNSLKKSVSFSQFSLSFQ